ncbi:hypothetical protein C0J52_03975 [Blattella germanica]|nr:hypothetical protein C0J52_03975 [Blattella germanica]
MYVPEVNYLKLSSKIFETTVYDIDPVPMFVCLAVTRCTVTYLFPATKALLYSPTQEQKQDGERNSIITTAATRISAVNFYLLARIHLLICSLLFVCLAVTRCTVTYLFPATKALLYSPTQEQKQDGERNSIITTAATRISAVNFYLLARIHLLICSLLSASASLTAPAPPAPAAPPPPPPPVAAAIAGTFPPVAANDPDACGKPDSCKMRAEWSKYSHMVQGVYDDSYTRSNIDFAAVEHNSHSILERGQVQSKELYLSDSAIIVGQAGFEFNLRKMDTPRKNNDCYFYYYSTCLKKNRKLIPCYWENQPGGCRKPHCSFQHKNPRDPPTVADMEKAAKECEGLKQQEETAAPHWCYRSYIEHQTNLVYPTHFNLLVVAYSSLDSPSLTTKPNSLYFWHFSSIFRPPAFKNPCSNIPANLTSF